MHYKLDMYTGLEKLSEFACLVVLSFKFPRCKLGTVFFILREKVIVRGKSEERTYSLITQSYQTL